MLTIFRAAIKIALLIVNTKILWCMVVGLWVIPLHKVLQFLFFENNLYHRILHHKFWKMTKNNVFNVTSLSEIRFIYGSHKLHIVVAKKGFY